MTKAEYAAYETAVSEFMKRHGIENLSTDSDDEGSFSWRGCDCCGSSLGGTRYACTGYNRIRNEVIEFSNVCQDCVYYAAYGQLDDETMLSISDE